MGVWQESGSRRSPVSFLGLLPPLRHLADGAGRVALVTLVLVFRLGRRRDDAVGRSLGISQGRKSPSSMYSAKLISKNQPSTVLSRPSSPATSVSRRRSLRNRYVIAGQQAIGCHSTASAWMETRQPWTTHPKNWPVSCHAGTPLTAGAIAGRWALIRVTAARPERQCLRTLSGAVPAMGGVGQQGITDCGPTTGDGVPRRPVLRQHATNSTYGRRAGRSGARERRRPCLGTSRAPGASWGRSARSGTGWTATASMAHRHPVCGLLWLESGNLGQNIRGRTRTQ